MCTGCGVGKGNIHTLLETTTNSIIQLPRDICGSKDQNAIHVISDTLHLYEELGFDSSGGVILTLTSAAAQRVDIIDKDN